MRQRIIPANSHNDFLLASAGETAHHQPIVITQKDVRELQLAKGAIAAGIAILMAELGITKEDIDEVLIAGAFGNYINKYNAQTLGLIPPVPPERVKFVGNAASVGAKKFLLSQAAKDEAHQIIETTEYIELSGRADFQEQFAEAMFLGQLSLG
ncbi:MAG: ATP-binding protein [candidate division KSB1 bacterium]|nr:ATP-binding protein [candidate division KSB1 bacterium]